jgi:hypothetical protein
MRHPSKIEFALVTITPEGVSHEIDRVWTNPPRA